MGEQVRVACVQNCASADMPASIAAARELCERAALDGAKLLCLPEFFSCLSMGDAGFEVGGQAEKDHPALAAFSELADRLDTWILLGSVAVTVDSGKLHNRSILIDANGRVAARYDKIHLFDVDLANGESYRESDVLEPGDAAVVAETPWGGLGMTICYDLRFAYLYRTLARAGAYFLTVPAAFTKTTGQAHWHVLLRARAIETGSYVFAPCQYGQHGSAVSYGHSLIVDPWGAVIADAGEDEGYAIADVDTEQVHRARAMIPALTHDRDYSQPPTGSRLVRASA